MYAFLLSDRCTRRYAELITDPPTIELSSVIVADVNGDKKCDIIAVNDVGEYFSVLLNTGKGSFEKPFIYPVEAIHLPPLMSDLNGDERPDTRSTII